jgi:ornithine--oxo-acid transaminase
MIEPIQGEAGIVVPPTGYLEGLRDLCTRKNVLLILDEIQSGLGRTGKWFAFQHAGIQPDGLIIGKALGGGIYPVSAFVATREVMDLFNPGSHGSTFGGNALAAAIGLEALKVLEEEGLIENSRVLGAHMSDRLRSMRRNVMTEVRGKGLWIGVEIAPEVISARGLCEILADEGVLTKDTHGTVIRFAPPLSITRDELDWGLDRVEKAVTNLVN